MGGLGTPAARHGPCQGFCAADFVAHTAPLLPQLEGLLGVSRRSQWAVSLLGYDSGSSSDLEIRRGSDRHVISVTVMMLTRRSIGIVSDQFPLRRFPGPGHWQFTQAGKFKFKFKFESQPFAPP